MDELNKLIAKPHINIQSSFDFFGLIKSYIYAIKNNMFDEKQKIYYRYIFSKPKVRKLITNMNKCGISFNDIHSDNFGFRENGEFVIIDSPIDSDGKNVDMDLVKENRLYELLYF